MSLPRLLRRASGAVALLVMLTGCGTRMSDTSVQAGAAAGTLEISAETLKQLRAALQAGPAAQQGQVQPGAAAPEAGVETITASFDDATAPVGAGPVAATSGRPAASSGAVTGRAEHTREVDQRGEARPGAAVAKPAAGTAKGAGAAEPSRPAVSSAKAAACAAPGAPLILGQVGNFSGVAGPVYQSARTTLAVWAKDVNARGGVACHPVVVYSQDDGAESARSAAIVQDMVQNKKVQALVGSFMVLSIAGYRSGIEAMKVPTIGGDVLSPDWTESPYLFPQGGGVDAQILGMLKQPVDLLGKKRFGLLFCVESSVCTTDAKIFEHYAPAAGGTWIYSSPISLTQPDFTAQCQNAKNNGVDVLILGMDGSSMQRVARSCTAVNYHPHYVTNALIISAAQSSDPLIRKDTMSTVSMNAPWMLEELPGQVEFRKALRTYAPDMLVDGPAIATWTSGRLFEAAIDRLGEAARTGPITTAMVMEGLGKIRNETLGGLAPPITFSPGQAHAPMIPAVFNEFLDGKGWSAPKGTKIIKFTLDAPTANAPAPAARSMLGSVARTPGGPGGIVRVRRRTRPRPARCRERP